MGVSLFVAVVYITVNFVVDVLYGVIDPRIRSHVSDSRPTPLVAEPLSGAGAAGRTARRGGSRSRSSASRSSSPGC